MDRIAAGDRSDDALSSLAGRLAKRSAASRWTPSARATTSWKCRTCASPTSSGELSQVKTLRAPRDVVEKLRLQPNDVLINEGGDKDKVGRDWVWSGELECYIHQNHVFRARPRLAELDGRHISAYGNEIGRKYFFDQAKQTTNLASISMRKVAAVIAQGAGR